jgi:hypothetical protein
MSNAFTVKNRQAGEFHHRTTFIDFDEFATVR